jgi:hypothetical protein
MAVELQAMQVQVGPVQCFCAQDRSSRALTRSSTSRRERVAMAEKVKIPAMQGQVGILVFLV